MTTEELASRSEAYCDLKPGKIVRLAPARADDLFGFHYDVPARGVVVQVRVLTIEAPPERVWAEIQSIGGDNGWYYWNWMWTLRGWMDRLLGGIGNRRSRPKQLEAGAELDSWTVTRHTGQDLTLVSRWRMQRLARLGLHVRESDGGSVLIEWVEFHPTLLTWLYWWAAYPFHVLIFRGLLRAIAHRATRPAYE